MEIRLGDNLKFGGNSPYKLSTIGGLGSADIRNGDGLYSGMDGGYMSTQYYGTRTITLKGFFISNICNADLLREGLLANLHIRYLYPVFITSFSGRFFYTEGYVTDVKCDIDNPKSGVFQISIVCPDPLIYDGGDGINSDSAWFQQIISKTSQAGYKTPYSLPTKWVSGETESIVNNLGTTFVYPTIILRGRFTNPKITNLTTNEFISLDYKTTAETEQINIDMRKRIITHTNNDKETPVTIASYRTLDSSWWGLAEGINKIELTSDSSSDTDYITVSYKIGYPGI